MTAAIALGITIASFLGGILWKVIGMSKDSGKLAQRVDHTEERAKEDREKFDKSLSELFNRTGATERAVTELNNRTSNAERSISDLTSKVDLLTSLCYRIDGKIDRVLETKGEKA